jgi:hypothetical protein
MAGVSLGQFKRYLSDKSQPPFGVIVSLAAASGADLNWLATGEGPMMAGEAAPPVPAPAGDLDAHLLGLVIDGLQHLYRQENARLPALEMGRLAGRVYNDLVAAYGSMEERRIGLKLALEMLRRELRAAPAPADEGKRMA